ncbi:MAG: transcriptional repressor [Endomicrobiia bacterium]
MNSLLKNILKTEGLRNTRTRNIIFNFFIKHSSHKSCAEIYSELKKKFPNIGRATVYRTLNLFSKSNIAEKIFLGDKINRFESKINKEHHDHLKCLRCGKIIEFSNKKIEMLQNKIASEKKFKLLWHRQELFGICYKCTQKKQK